MKKEKKEEKEQKEEKQENKVVEWMKEYVPFVIALILVLSFKTYLFAPIKVNGTSMDDTLKDGDIMLLNIISLKVSGIKRFDIVVIKEKNELIIKRVIGLPGEEVEYKDNKLYINGEEIDDPYGTTPTNDFEKTTVGEGEYFVLGDNRAVSKDSRFLGTFTMDDIKGKTEYVLYPIDRFGKKE